MHVLHLHFAATVIGSCHIVILYEPGGTLSSTKLPSWSVRTTYGCSAMRM